MKHIREEICSEAPVEHVWAVLCDTSHWHHWAPRSKFSDSSGPVDQVGTTYVDTTRLMGFTMQMTTQVVEVEALRLYHEHTDHGPVDTVIRLAPDGDATRLVVESDSEVPGKLHMLYGAVEGEATEDEQGQVRIVGFDTDPVILDMVKDGSIDATVAQQPRLMGLKAVGAAIAAAAGETVEAFIPVETILVTADNVEHFLAGEAVVAEEAQGEAASMAPVAEVAQTDEPDEAVTWPQLTRSLEYGDDPKQVIHVYELEPRAEPRPAVVFFHGGGLVYGQPLQDADGGVDSPTGLRDLHGRLSPLRRGRRPEPVASTARRCPARHPVGSSARG